MKAVVGLGNPGVQYRNTRHNVGFQAAAELARRFAAPAAKVRFDAEVTDVLIGGEKVLLAAPQTYMNLSGRSVQPLVDYFGIELSDLLVVCDDMNLDLGRLRLRPSGSAGGQKGLADIIRRLGSQEFPRLRIGIGRPPGRMEPADYVLSRFRSEEAEEVEHMIARAADAVEAWIRDGLEAAMNRFNVRPGGSEGMPERQS